ncbi:hypothetical protein BASA50_011332 [Batrachochytrium salamandrivorans]|uniref:Protein PNS1 n=1 Tax=Batrachochytrium salamandrivorans TaxID=1357716 RepID=A0ABQ8EWI1_9FUNG|nr:hypothetical protein BASA50_011332 [Batrachochytrium salamandrivorans]
MPRPSVSIPPQRDGPHYSHTNQFLSPIQPAQDYRSSTVKQEHYGDISSTRSSIVNGYHLQIPQSSFSSPTYESPVSATALIPRKPSVSPSTRNAIHVPVKRRKICNDSLWLLLFLAGTGGMAAISHLAFTRGYYPRLLYSRDSEGNLCGVSANVPDSSRDLSNQPYLAFYDLDLPNAYRRCVSQCPTDTQSLNSLICQYDTDPAPTASNQVKLALIASGNCTMTSASTEALNRCVPNVLLSSSVVTGASITNTTALTIWASTLVTDLNRETFVAMLFQQLGLNWWIILVSLSITIGLSYAWTFLLVAMSRTIVWATLLLTLSLTWGASGFFLYMFMCLKYNNISPLSATISAVGGYYTTSTLLVVTCVCFIISTSISIATIVLRKTISLAIRIIVETSKSFRKLHILSVTPLVKLSVVIFLGLYTAIIVAIISTIGAVETSVPLSYTIVNMTYVVPSGKTFVPSNFVAGLDAISVSGVISEYYFSSEKENPQLINKSVLTAIFRVFKSHMGSASLGSISIPFIALVNIIIGLFRQHSQKTALYGHPFCECAVLGIGISERHKIRLKVVSGVSGFVIFFGKVLITLAAGFSGMALVCTVTQKGTPTSTLAPILAFIFIFVFLTTSVIIEPFGTAIETVFICLCLDIDMHSGADSVLEEKNLAFKRFDLVNGSTV